MFHEVRISEIWPFSMSTYLPTNLDDLLRNRGVEFKAAWDSKTVGPQVIKTSCGVASDWYSSYGGDIVI